METLARWDLTILYYFTDPEMVSNGAWAIKKEYCLKFFGPQKEDKIHKWPRDINLQLTDDYKEIEYTGFDFHNMSIFEFGDEQLVALDNDYIDFFEDCWNALYPPESGKPFGLKVFAKSSVDHVLFVVEETKDVMGILKPCFIDEIKIGDAFYIKIGERPKKAGA